MLDFPDNVTTSQRGTLVVCEDNTTTNFLRGLTPPGHLFDIAQNRIDLRQRAPTASTTSSPGRRSAATGETLFVNIQAGRA